MLKLSQEEIANLIKICNEMPTMAQAAAKLNIQYKTLRRLAKKYGCFKPNQAGVGLKKKERNDSYNIHDILNGKYPQMQSFKVKQKLLNAGIKKHCCEICKLTEWNNKPIPIELDHIDGNSTNHKLENLRLLCPNCHAQTETYRGKNKSNFNAQVLQRQREES